MTLIKPNQYVGDLIPYVPGKPVEELERELGIRGAVKIASNENPLGPSPLAENALKEALHSLNRYPDGDAFYLKEKLSNKLGIKAETLIFGNGSNDVIDIAARTFMKTGDEAIFGEYAFIPNNPTGTVVKKDEFEWFIENVPEDILVLVDEAYFEYVDDKDYPNSLDYHDKGKSIITVRTFSKIYGLAGLRLGYGIAHEDIISNMQRVRHPFNSNSLSQIGAIAALEDDEHIERTKRVNSDGLSYVTQEVCAFVYKFCVN